jgi:multidrug efflux pump subunit AcrA (membrane-fusion protein)
MGAGLPLPACPTSNTVTPPSDTPTATDAVAGLQRFLSAHGALLEHASLREAAVQFVSDLAARHGCERVSLGLVEHDRIVLAAMSGSAETDLRRREFDELRAAMEEALDQDVLLRVPEPLDAPPRVLAAHALLLSRGVDAAITVPLVAHGDQLGALTLEWRDGALPADFDERALTALARLSAPVLALMRRNERPWWRRTLQGLRDAVTGGSVLRRLALAAGALALAVLLALPLPAHLGGRARVEGSVERALAAPAHGYLKAVHARPGDEVRAGQLLAELAEQELEVDRRRLEGEVAQHEGAYMAAIARSDRQQMGVALARMEESKAQLELASQQLGRTRIESPFDGVVIAGDLTRSVGAPVKRGEVMLTVAPLDGWRIVVEVDERDIDRVRVGQRGQLALSALPFDSLPITVRKLTPVARSAEGANVFEVEAALDDAAGARHAAELRPGLQGAARLAIGSEPLAWRALRALWSQLRLRWWLLGW